MHVDVVSLCLLCGGDFSIVASHYIKNSHYPHPPKPTQQVIRRLVRGHSGSGEENKLEIPLSLGGRVAGSLSLRIGIRKREYAYELVRPHLAKPRVVGGGEEEGKEEEGEEEGDAQTRRVVFAEA